jgi:hypothetical protein
MPPLNFVPCPQHASCVLVSWTSAPGAVAYEVYITAKRLSAPEVDALGAGQRVEGVQTFRVGPELTAAVDDITPEGERRFYAAAVVQPDGSIHPGRFRAGPSHGDIPATSFQMSTPPAPPRAAAAPARPSTGTTGSMRVPAAAAPAAARAAEGAPVPDDPMAARRAQQEAARARAAGHAVDTAPETPRSRAAASPADTGSEGAVPAAAAAPVSVRAAEGAPVSDDPMAARRAQQEAARARARGESVPTLPHADASETHSSAPAVRSAHAEAPPAAAAPSPVSSSAAEGAPVPDDPMAARRAQQEAARARARGEAVPSPEQGAAPAADSEPSAPAGEVEPPGNFSARPMDLKFTGHTQTWDGTRIAWEREKENVAAYEILVSDHPLLAEEVQELMSGESIVNSAAVAVNRLTTCIIDNLTPREGRGYYAVLARARDGTRRPIACTVGDAEATSRHDAPFLLPHRTGEVRAMAEEMVGGAEEALERFKSGADEGARRDAERLARDALLVFPGHEGAQKVLREVGKR